MKINTKCLTVIPLNYVCELLDLVKQSELWFHGSYDADPHNAHLHGFAVNQSCQHLQL